MKAITLLAGLALLVTGCATVTGGGGSATAEMKNANGKTVGMATFTEVSGGVRVLLEARDLPAGEKGVHIHAVGKCDPPQLTTAGGHFNPAGKQHGTLNPQGPHAGDLPNIVIAGNGSGRLETFTDRVSLAAGTNSVFDADGSALVVHAGPDDFKTDPTGSSGGRIACGLIIKK